MNFCNSYGLLMDMDKVKKNTKKKQYLNKERKEIYNKEEEKKEQQTYLY